MKKFSGFFKLLMFVSYILLSYNYFDGWWYSFLGTLCILLMSFAAWKNSFSDITGLRAALENAIKCLPVLVLVYGLTRILICKICLETGLNYELKSWHGLFHITFYTLNEEIILGGVALWFLKRWFNITPGLISVGLAMGFSIIHYVFYRWVALDYGILNPITLISLFFAGVLRNNLILWSGHIGYSWALHLGWMGAMFGSFFGFPGADKNLSEPEIFNVFLGSKVILVLVVMVGLLSFIPLYYRPATK